MAKSARSKVEIFRKDFITLARRAGGAITPWLSVPELRSNFFSTLIRLE